MFDSFIFPTDQCHCSLFPSFRVFDVNFMRFLFISALAIFFTGPSVGTLLTHNIGFIPQLLKQEGYTHDEWMQFWKESIGSDYIATRKHLFKLSSRISADLRESYVSALSQACLRIESYRSSSDVSGDHSAVNGGSSRKKERPYSYLFFFTAYNLHITRFRELDSRSREFARVMRKLFNLAAYPQQAIRVANTIPNAVGTFDWISNLRDDSVVPRFTIALVSAYAIDLVRSPNVQLVNTRYMTPPQVNRLIPWENKLGPNKNAIFVCMMDATLIPASNDYLEFLRVRNWFFNGGRSSNEHVEFREPASYADCLRWTPISVRGG